MVNKEKQEKDGFGLPSTDVRKKDNALIEAARIADKMAKWYAEFGDDIPVVEEVVIVELEEEHFQDTIKKQLEAQKVIDAEAAEELKAETEALAKAKADKKAKLQAELDALQ